MAPKQLEFDFSLVKKIEKYNATTDELRTGMFAPIEKLTKNSATYKKFVENGKKRSVMTSWGDMTIKQQILTQVHRDLYIHIIPLISNLSKLVYL
jgi:hypothetical protein